LTLLSRSRVAPIAMICALAAGLVACSGDDRARAPAAGAAAGEWITISGPGLSPRADPILVATPDRILTLSGTPLDHGNRAPTLTDGAVYNPATGVWTNVSRAPFTPFGAAWIGDRVFVAGSDCSSTRGEDEGVGQSEVPCPASRLRAAIYDVNADSWTEVPSPHLPYEIGPDSYGTVLAIGSRAVLRLQRRDANGIVYSYETWSRADGWGPIASPAGNDNIACQADGAIVSLSYAYMFAGKGYPTLREATRLGVAGPPAHYGNFRVTALDSKLDWSKLVSPPGDRQFENEPTLACTATTALVWQVYGNPALAFTFHVNSHAFGRLPEPRGGFPNVAVTVPAANDSALVWDRTDDNSSTLEYHAATNEWTAFRDSPATRTGIYRLAADTGASADGETFIAHQRGGAGAKFPDQWQTAKLP
jgi:hypothetical protein